MNFGSEITEGDEDSEAERRAVIMEDEIAEGRYVLVRSARTCW